MRPKMLCSPDGGNGGGAPAGAAGANANPTAGTPPAPQGTPPDGGKGAPGAAHVNHDEFVEYGKRVQKLEDRGRDDSVLVRAIAEKLGIPLPGASGDKPVGQQPKGGEQTPRPPDGAADVVTRSELNLRDAIIEAGVSLTKEQREVVTTLFGAQKPPAGTEGEWLKKLLPSIGVKLGAQPAGPPARKDAVTNLGAPGSNPTAARPRIGESSKEEVAAFWKTASKEEKDEVWNEWEARSGARSSHFARKPRK